MFQVVRKKSIHLGHFLNLIKAGVLERKMKKNIFSGLAEKELVSIHASGLDSFIDYADIN